MVGRLIVAHRQRLALTQEELARKAGLSVRGLRDLESGRVRIPRKGSIRLLADALELTGPERDRFYREAYETNRTSGDGAPSGAGRVAVLPAQLPADTTGFAGRDNELDLLDTLLTPNGAATEPTDATIFVVSGTAGVGKSALAVRWAHRVRDQFPDGQLFINLRGYAPGESPIAPVEALHGFLAALHVPPQRIPAGHEAPAALYRSLLADRRMLVVLDNARDTEQVRSLLPGAAGCRAVITSRSGLFGLAVLNGARLLTLGLLSTDEARQLLAGRLGAARVAAEPAAVDEIIAQCGRLPLALAIVAALAAAHPRRPLSVLASSMYEAGDLDAFDAGDVATDLRAVFSWSYRTLSPDAARLFRLLGLHPGPEFATAAAASVAGVPPRDVRPLLAELTRAHLLGEQQSGRYAFHDLLRTYAAELARTIDSEPARRQAVHRTLDHYLHTAYTAAQQLHPHRDPITLATVQPGVTPEQLGDMRALDWFGVERPALIAAIHHAAAVGFDSHARQLAWTLVYALDRCGAWHDQVTVQQVALQAARRLGDRSGQAIALRVLAHAYLRLGDLNVARAHLRQALDLSVALGDDIGRANASMGLSEILDRQGNHAEALRLAEDALQWFTAANDLGGQARALNLLGLCHIQLGDHQQAIDCCRRAIALHRQTGDRVELASTWDSLGYAHHHNGDHRRAIQCFRTALDLSGPLGDRYETAEILTHLGDAYRAAGDSDRARQAWRQALDILRTIDHPDADLVRTRLGENQPP